MLESKALDQPNSVSRGTKKTPKVVSAEFILYGCERILQDIVINVPLCFVGQLYGDGRIVEPEQVLPDPRRYLIVEAVSSCISADEGVLEYLVAEPALAAERAHRDQVVVVGCHVTLLS